MRYLSLIALVPLLAACSKKDESAPTPPPPPPAISSVPLDDTLVIDVNSAVTTDNNGVDHANATLELSGMVEQSINLGDILGTLMHVNTNSYAPYTVPNGQTIAVFTSWFAGQGEEIIITYFAAENKLVIEHRFGGEGGVCTARELLAEVALPGPAKISIGTLGQETDQSSIAFCYAQQIQN